MDTLTYAGHAAGAIEPPRAFRQRLASLLHRLAVARKARNDFETLRGANDHILADIGLTRAQLDVALSAPFWVNPCDRMIVSRSRRRR